MKKILLILILFAAILPSRAETILECGIDVKDRIIAKFSDSTYAVMHKDDPLHVLYYSADDRLLYREEKTGSQYPYEFYKYDTAGKLVNKGVRISKAETYIYSPGGKLIAHWVGSRGYDENGNVIMTREYYE